MADPKIRFKGDATTGFHSGIPARDLTTEEYDALDTAQRAVVRESPLYDYAGYKGKLDAAKAAAVSAPSDDKASDDKPSDPSKDETPAKGS